MGAASDLPEGWVWTTLGEITDINPRIDKSTIPDDLQVSFIPMPAVGAADGKIDVSQLKQAKEVKKGYTPFQERDVLFAKITPCMENGKMAVVPMVSNGYGFGSTEFHVLRPREGVDPHYIYHFVSNALFRKEAAHRMTGAVGQKRVPTAYLADCAIPLAPFSHQNRIVAKIEELFSEIDKGVENFTTTREQLKVYRQALLKHAFEGRLTEQWRKDNADKLETAEQLLTRIKVEREKRYQEQIAEWEKSGKQGSKPKAPKHLPPLTAEELVELPKLPEGWGWTRLIEACEAVVDCHNKTAPYQVSGVPLVRTPSIRNMKLIFDDTIRYVSEKTYSYWSRRCPPLPGDILFTREAPMGEAALIPEGQMVCMGQRIILFRPGKFLSGRYLLYATQSSTFKKAAYKVAVGTGVKHLRVGDIERLIFPLCSVKEQNEIASQLEARLSEMDHLELSIANSLQQVEALRYSILKRAFSGQLVLQDPNDEPASLLLDRIRAKREAAQQEEKTAEQKRGMKRIA